MTGRLLSAGFLVQSAWCCAGCRVRELAVVPGLRGGRVLLRTAHTTLGTCTHLALATLHSTRHPAQHPARNDALGTRSKSPCTLLCSRSDPAQSTVVLPSRRCNT